VTPESGIGSDGDQPSARDRGLPQDGISEFLQSDYPRLVAGLTLVAGSRVAAEDAVQEGLARAWERSMRGEQIESLRGFVAVVATNLLRSRFRRLLVEQRTRQRLGERLDGARTLPAAHLSTADLRVDLARALKLLPRRQREAVVLYYFADLGIEDIARALHARPATAKGILYRGRQSLLRILGPTYWEGGDHAG
jgi:RNA polymerase sigma factor (sigma-70 family)